MQINVNLRSKIPIYIQIMDQIKHKIAIGELKQGDQLPTVRQLATDLRVNFNTIARAYRLLDEEGLISTQHGRGTYILPLLSEENGDKLRRKDIEWLTRKYLSDAARLGNSPKEINTLLSKLIKQWIDTGYPPSIHEE